jgi:hypothetical protein
MADTYKILGQASPSTTTETELYVCLYSTIASSLIVCNRGAAAATFRVSASKAGAATANKDYLYYEISIPAHDSFASTLGVTLGTGDKIRVYASSGDLSFNLFGNERT